MSDIYKTWVDFGIDGFRIDTVKHVNMEFWQKFSPGRAWPAAKADGNEGLLHVRRGLRRQPGVHVAVHDRPASCRRRSTSASRRSALDFAKGKPTTKLRDFFAGDDYYTDTDSNAYELPTFLGNHDMGRVGKFLGTAAPPAPTCCSGTSWPTR